MDPVTAAFNSVTATITLIDKVWSATPTAEQTAIAKSLADGLINLGNVLANLAGEISGKKVN
jgi:hypothetical protein